MYHLFFFSPFLMIFFVFLVILQAMHVHHRKLEIYKLGLAATTLLLSLWPGCCMHQGYLLGSEVLVRDVGLSGEGGTPRKVWVGSPCSLCRLSCLAWCSRIKCMSRPGSWAPFPGS